MIKIKYPVKKVGGTVLIIGDLLHILGIDRIIYTIDLKEDRYRTYLKMKFAMGDFIWLYCIPSRNFVISIFNSDEQGEPPEPDSFQELGE